MERHTKNYTSHFEIGSQDYFTSEMPIIVAGMPELISGAAGFEIHHIINRMKARPELDQVENLICLTTEQHADAHKKKYSRIQLFKIHKEFLIKYGKPYDEEFLQQLMNEAIN